MRDNFKEKIKILMIGAETPGGVSTYINEYINWSNKKVFEYHMTTSDEFIPIRKLTNLGREINIIKHKFTGLYSLISLFRRIREIRKIIIENKINIIHLHTARAGFLGCIGSYGLNIKIVYTGHTWRFEQKGNKLLRYLFSKFEKFICFRSNIVTFLTEGDLLKGLKFHLVNINKCRYIKTQINPSPYNIVSNEVSNALRNKFKIPENSFIIGNCGYLSERKDPITFINIAAEVIKERDDVYFLWVGDGELKDEVIKRIDELGIEKKVYITGWKKPQEIPLYLSIMNLFLFTSLLEGVPLSILSAQASNILVISADYKGSGVKELIVHEENGLIFKTKDVKKGKELIINILNDKCKWEQIIINMKNRFLNSNSNPKNMAQQYESIYESILQ